MEGGNVGDGCSMAATPEVAVRWDEQTALYEAVTVGCATMQCGSCEHRDHTDKVPLSHSELMTWQRWQQQYQQWRPWCAGSIAMCASAN